jgi:hypothetical protein
VGAGGHFQRSELGEILTPIPPDWTFSNTSEAYQFDLITHGQAAPQRRN